MPPTTGGSTSGSRTSDRSRPCPGKLVRASTSASGTPSTMQRTVVAAEVRRLSHERGARRLGGDQRPEVGPVDPGDHRDQRQQHEQPPRPRPGGRPSGAARPALRARDARPVTRVEPGLAEARVGQDAAAVVAEDEVHEVLGQVGLVAAGDGGDRVAVDDVVRLGELDARRRRRRRRSRR